MPTGPLERDGDYALPMPGRRRVALLFCAFVVVLAITPAPASAAQSCGVVSRQFTDGGAQVIIVKGRLKCATARTLMRRYWGTRVTAFRETVGLRVAGIRWTCRPTTSDFPFRWACSGGGPRRDRFRVTARE